MTTKLFMLLQVDLFFANFWWLGAKRGYIAYGVMGVMLVQCQSLFTTLAMKKNIG